MDPVQSGVSQAGNHWQKTYFEIITNEGERSRRVVFGAFGNVVEQVKSLPKGAHVEVKFNAESRDYIDKNGQKRYSTDLMCYGLAVITRQNMQPQYQTPAQQMPQPQTSPEQFQQQFQQQYQQTPPPPTAYPPAPPAPGTAAPVQPAQTTAQPQQQQPTADGELPPKNLGFQY